MEHGIVHSHLTEKEVKPQDLLQQYARQMALDNEKLRSLEIAPSVCPACSSPDGELSFSKCNLTYTRCRTCTSLYISKRPSQKELTAFFRNSKARELWLSQIWPITLESRKSKILRPLVEWMETFAEEHFGRRTINMAELYPLHWGLLQVSLESKIFSRYTLVEPLFEPRLCTLKSPESYIEDLNTSKTFDAISLMDTLSRTQSPAATLAWVEEHLNEGGICFGTAILSTGFDVMMLGSQNESLIPPDHLNVISFEGLNKLIANTDLEVIEMSTPGVLDVQNVKTVAAQTGAPIPAFFHYLFSKQNPELEQELQDFLQRYQLSSRARFVLRKGKTTS